MRKHLTSRSNWNLEVLVFMEGGKPEYPEKNPRSKDENQQQTQPTHDTGTGNRTRVTMVEGECSHHCAVPAPLSNLNDPISTPYSHNSSFVISISTHNERFHDSHTPQLSWRPILVCTNNVSNVY